MAKSQLGKLKLEWNSKAIIDLVRSIAKEQEEAAAKRIWVDVRSKVPIGKYSSFGKYRYPKRRTPLIRRKQGDDAYKRGKAKKDWQIRRSGRLFRSIIRIISKYRDGGTLVWAGNTRTVYYAHFIEFGTVFMRRRRGYKMMRYALNRERRRFYNELQSRLKD
jgi:hypothetical protein